MLRDTCNLNPYPCFLSSPTPPRFSGAVGADTPFLLPSLSFFFSLNPRDPLLATLPTMSTIQNIKNFIRHGKQARLVTPHSEPTTDVSTIHAEQQPHSQSNLSPALGSFDPDLRGNGPAASQKRTETQVRQDRSVEIERIVQEENVSRSKMPKYPGLERWILIEKMGDGAFSNVYRAKDSTTEYGEVAIKVVRKFEMNSNQVG